MLSKKQAQRWNLPMNIGIQTNPNLDACQQLESDVHDKIVDGA